MAKANPFLKKPVASVKGATKVEKKKGLGRGLDGLLGSGSTRLPSSSPVVSTVAAPVQSVASAAPARLELVIADIERSPYQPRRDFKQEELQELAESLKNNGLVQPPTVRKNAKGRWELIAGERRMRAAQLAGWKKIEVIVRDVDDLTAAAMTATENIQREDLNPIEEAESYRTLQDTFNLTQAEVAEKVGKGRATVANAVRLLELPEEVKTMVESSSLSVGHAKVLLSLDDEKSRILFARECVERALTVRQLEQKVQQQLNPPAERPKGKDDLPEPYVKSLTANLKRHLGCAVRLTSGRTLPNGKHMKGVLEIDFFDNDELDRVLRMIGVTVE